MQQELVHDFHRPLTEIRQPIVIHGAEETKMCRPKKGGKMLSCGQTKPLSAFARNSKNKDGRGNICKECCLDYERLRRSENRGVLSVSYRGTGTMTSTHKPPRTWVWVAFFWLLTLLTVGWSCYTTGFVSGAEANCVTHNLASR